MRYLAILFIFLTQFFILIHAGWSIRCYGCTGYDISRPMHRITNNPACADGNFDYRQVEIYTAYSPGFSCYTFTFNTGQYEITQRYMVRSPLARSDDEKSLIPRTRDRDYREREYRERDYREREYRERDGRENRHGIEGTIVKGYYCHTDYCNGAGAVASSLSVLLVLSALVYVYWLYTSDV
ncbi:hypothetical protein SK128_019606 [Halocaridina rubra]|uniref:Uncharacterized protein n=1 Tax=Halocaridina rubra TaxID=373956 RepID=A0AAN8ZUJ5_HALRR